jgi:hypothetical protein
MIRQILYHREEDMFSLTTVVAALEALYQVRPGLGLFAAVDAIWINTPPRFCSNIFGMMTLVDSRMALAFTFMQRSKSASVTSTVG